MPVGAVIRETGDAYFGNGDKVVIDLATAREGPARSE